jgi:hypothetical protein
METINSMELIQGFTDSLIKNSGFILAVTTFILAQWRFYEKGRSDREKKRALAEKKATLEEEDKKLQKIEAEKMLKAINEVGNKLEKFKEKSGQETMDIFLQQGHLRASIEGIKGKLDGILIFLPGNKQGHA